MIKRLLLVVVTTLIGIGGVRGEGTYRLEQVTSVEAGGLYVFEQDGYVMIGEINSKGELKTTNNYLKTGLTGEETYVWTLEAKTGGYYMKNVSPTDKDKPYLENKIPSTGNKKPDLSFAGGSVTSVWKFEFQEDKTVLIQNTKNDNRYLAYSDNTSHRYKAYSTGDMTYAHAIKVYRLVEEVFTDVTLNAACHDDNDMVFSTFSSSKPFVVPENLTVAEVGVDEDQIQVSCYKTGDIVPANTGVMVASSAGGTYRMVVTSSQGQSVLGAANCLRPSGEGITVEQMAAKDPNCTFYRLTMHNGTNIGFWWGAEDGAAFKLTANKAYLAVPKSAEIKSDNLWIGSLEANITQQENKKLSDGITYSISGIQYKSNKGIRIKDGKKYISK